MTYVVRCNVMQSGRAVGRVCVREGVMATLVECLWGGVIAPRGEGVITPRGVNISSPALRNEAGLGQRAKKCVTPDIP